MTDRLDYIRPIIINRLLGLVPRVVCLEAHQVCVHHDR